jgi:hypothetical protein
MASMPSKKTVALQRLLSTEEIEKLTEPLLEVIDCDRISFTALKLNYKAEISKLYQTGRPLLLELNGYKLLLCNPNMYIDLERRRQWILAGCQTIEDLVRVEKIDWPDERIQKLKELKRGIAETKGELKSLHYSQDQATARLASMQKEADSLRRALRRRKGKKPNSRHS